MKCDRVLELLSDYIDGELSPAGVLGVQSHLRRCSGCATEHAALRRTVQLVALYGRQQAPIDCREAVMARLSETPALTPRRSWPSLGELFALRIPATPAWARAGALAGVAVLSLSAGTLWFNQPHEPTPAPAATRLVQEDHARIRESSELLQALGRDDGYILAADIVDDYR